MSNEFTSKSDTSAPVKAGDPMIETDAALRPDPAVVTLLTAAPVRNAAVWDRAAAWMTRGTAPQFRLSDDPPTDTFRYGHAEDLLDQMATLLDRAIAGRAEWLDKLGKAFYLDNELQQYIDSDKVYANEVRDGLYEVPYVEAVQEAEAGRATTAGQTDAATEQANLYNTVDSGANLRAVQGAEQLTAWASAFPYSGSGAGPELNLTWNDVSNSRSQHLFNAAATHSQWYTAFTDKGVYVELLDRRGARDASAARAVALKRRSDWEALNRQYKQRRTEIARLANERKVAAFTLPGGALNYRDQMDAIRIRIVRDASDALSRITIAARGLALIYGYSDPLPPAIMSTLTSRNADDRVLDEALVWVRDAQAWLTRFRQLDQSYVLPVSLKSLLTPKAWQDGLDAGQWQFDLPVANFGAQRYVRIRGVRGYAYGCGVDAGYWQADLTVPPESFTRQAGEQQIPLDQSKLPPILLPRVGSRMQTQETEFVGATALFNASPFGRWTVKISQVSTQRTPLARITDVELELAITMRT